MPARLKKILGVFTLRGANDNVCKTWGNTLIY